jgi:hypothetical protein
MKKAVEQAKKGKHYGTNEEAVRKGLNYGDWHWDDWEEKDLAGFMEDATNKPKVFKRMFSPDKKKPLNKKEFDIAIEELDDALSRKNEERLAELDEEINPRKSFQYKGTNLEG